MRSGAAQPHVYAKDIAQISLNLPPLVEQKRIAAILDKANEIKAKRELALAKLDELAECTFIDMFGDPVQNEMNWDLKTIEEIASSQKYSIVDGPFGSSLKSADYKNRGVPVVRIANVTKKGDFNPSNLLFISEDKFYQHQRSSIKANDVLVTRVGTLGNTCVFPNNIGNALLSTTGVCKITTNLNLMLPVFLHKAIKTKTFQSQIHASASTSVQKYFNLTALKGWKIIVPPIDLQKLYVSKIEKIDKKIRLLNLNHSKIIDFYNSLQNQAFTTGFNA
jgi:type I restriction enzyme S subunit